MIKKLARKLTAKTIAGGFDPDDEEKLLYGYEALLLNAISVSFILLVGVLLHIAKETLIFVVYFLKLRGNTGGLHLANSTQCIFASVILCNASAYVAHSLDEKAVAYVILPVLVSIIYIILRAPINHLNLNLQ